MTEEIGFDGELSRTEKNSDQEELYEHYRIEVDKGQSPLRIDKFLMNRIEHTSRSKIQHACDAECILVNNKPVKASYHVKPADVITVVLPHPVREVELIPENIPLNIIYEDDDLIIVNKAAGMVVHPAYGNYSGTLVNALYYHFNALPLYNKGLERPGLVHRIDKNTSGLLVVAKTELAMDKLAKEFFDRTIERRYIALAWGDFSNDAGTVTGNIGRNVKNRKVMQVFPDGDSGKHAVTHYRVLERFGYVTLIECKLETGRTHQIRVHMKYAGHPLFNDNEYGGDKILKGTTFTKYKQFIENCFEACSRQALHAKSIGFIHPTTKKKMFFESDLPADMKSLLKKWRKYVINKNE